jgi:hypothetical protein
MRIRGCNNTGSLCNATTCAREKSLSLVPLPAQFLSDILVTAANLIKLPRYLAHKAQNFIVNILGGSRTTALHHMSNYILLLGK